jgi:hypothetical protein
MRNQGLPLQTSGKECECASKLLYIGERRMFLFTNYWMRIANLTSQSFQLALHMGLTHCCSKMPDKVMGIPLKSLVCSLYAIFGFLKC